MPTGRTDGGPVGVVEFTGTAMHGAREYLLSSAPNADRGRWRPWAWQRDISTASGAGYRVCITTEDVASDRITCSRVTDSHARAVDRAVVKHSISLDGVAVTTGVDANTPLPETRLMLLVSTLTGAPFRITASLVASKVFLLTVPPGSADANGHSGADLVAGEIDSHRGRCIDLNSCISLQHSGGGDRDREAYWIRIVHMHSDNRRGARSTSVQNAAGGQRSRHRIERDSLQYGAADVCEVDDYVFHQHGAGPGGVRDHCGTGE